MSGAMVNALSKSEIARSNAFFSKQATPRLLYSVIVVFDGACEILLPAAGDSPVIEIFYRKLVLVIGRVNSREGKCVSGFRV
jgi:hypothetical protein